MTPLDKITKYILLGILSIFIVGGFAGALFPKTSEPESKVDVTYECRWETPVTSARVREYADLLCATPVKGSTQWTPGFDTEGN